MKTNKKRLIACAAISLLAAVQPSAGREIETPETAVRLVEGRTFRVRKNRNGFSFPTKIKPPFRNARRR